MDLGLEGVGAAVAASSAGLGLGCAAALAAEGARVVMNGRDQARLADAVEQVGHGAVGVVGDVSTPEGAKRFVASAIEALGQVDILVPNAGGPRSGRFKDLDLADYESAIDLSLLSVVAMCQVAVPPMCDRGWGRVVAITSVGVERPIPGMVLSNTARSGATAFLKTLAVEVAPAGVTVNSVQPGSHDTARIRQLLGDDVSGAAASIPVGRLGVPADLGALVAFLCSSNAGFVTGVSIPIDGGASIALSL